MIFDYFDNEVEILRLASPEEVVRAKDGELDAADREALRKRAYVVIDDGRRRRICHSGFLREDSTGEINRRLRGLGYKNSAAPE